MKIVHASLRQVRLPLVRSFETSSHRKDYLEHLLVQVRDADGVEGWGEIASPSDPYYCSETTATSWHVAERYLLPAIVGAEWEEPSQAGSAWRKIRGHEFAKAGVDMAAWSLAATAQGIALATLLGGTRERVVAGVSLGIEPTIDALIESIAGHLSAGYRRVKLKVAPGWDVEPVRAARAAFPGVDLHVDANGGYEATEESFAVMRELDGEALTMIEQPFAPSDFVSHAALQTELDTPLCLDESIVTVADVRTMLALGAGRIVNIKVSRMGGLTTATLAHALCLGEGVPVWCGGMHEFGIGRAANVAISALPGFSLPSDVSASEKYYARDIITPPVEVHDGEVTVPTTPGLGFDVDLDLIEAHTSRTATFPAAT